MPTWLSDPTTGMYLILFVALVIAAGVWVRNRTRRTLLIAAGLFAALALLGLCDYLFESPREESVRKVREMAAAVNERNNQKFLAHVSDSFTYKNWKKPDAVTVIELAQRYNVTAAVFDFNRERYNQVSPTELDIVFDARADSVGNERFPMHFGTRFVKDPDGQWRMKTFAFYDYVSKEDGGEKPLPGMP
ncbi:hypothetical protein [Fimbriiglobus ruber]|uniref:Uncharacterized protein n=1 Tax=Fimbriiglobus ruber TaxID=1908690 RepID=A0A225DMI2_9BACT|nr:hypothetical protein [Fimbriiglobus ruber]OWK38666.1 hypothetical protein FRUB_07786 [Fimbriiglobus ruber]